MICQGGRSFRTKCARSVVMFNQVGECGCPLYSDALPGRNRETYGYAIEYVAIIAGHIRRSEKARIYGKGAEMYKSIYKKGTQRR